MLFDLGEVSALGARELLRVSHVFVSHTHIDHFAGFDRLLRLRLKRERPLHLLGPEGFIDRVAAKLQAYTWNLLDEATPDLVVTAHEFIGDRLCKRSRFAARMRFARCDEPIQPGEAGIVLDEDDFQVRAAMLDHGTPCLAFAAEERQRVNVLKIELQRLGLRVGPWISDAKRAIRANTHDGALVDVGDGRLLELGELRSRCMITGPGQKIGYVVDAADHASNRAKIVNLCRDADQLFIETAFADEDAALARAKNHLTAGGAGRFARDAGVNTVVGFHVSARYANEPSRLAEQLQLAFRPDGARG